MTTELSEILLDHQVYQMVKRNQCFGNHLHPHHHGSIVTRCVKHPLYIPT